VDADATKVLHIQTICRHIKNTFCPCLVTAAVKAFQASGSDTGPLDVEHKPPPQTSCRYFPVALCEGAGHDSKTGDGVEFDVDDRRGSPMDVGALMDDGMDLEPEDHEGRIHEAFIDVQDSVWSSKHHHKALCDESDGSDDNNEEPEMDMEQGNDIYDDWDEQDDIEGENTSCGLSALEQLGEDFERDAIENGESEIFHIWICELIVCVSAEIVSTSDMSTLRAYAFKINAHLTDTSFAQLPFTFPNDVVPTVNISRSRIQFLSGVTPVHYHCCINSCCCFVGPHKDLTCCPYCHEDCYLPHGDGQRQKPSKIFNYIPLIPHLVTMYANAEKAKEMRYQAFEHDHIDGRTTDVFYQWLLRKKVNVGRQALPHQYCSDPQDATLGLSTYGFGPFKKCKSMAWQLITISHLRYNFIQIISSVWV
jgi:hypothetical protein